jgi:hypothetical protein
MCRVQFDMESDVYAIPVEVMRGPGEQLFDHIAASLARYHTL